ADAVDDLRARPGEPALRARHRDPLEVFPLVARRFLCLRPDARCLMPEIQMRVADVPQKLQLARQLVVHDRCATTRSRILFATTGFDARAMCVDDPSRAMTVTSF